MSGYQRTICEGLKSLGIIKEQQIEEALNLQKTQRRRFGQALVELGFIPSENIANTLISQFGIRAMSLDPARISRSVIKLVSHDFACLHRVIPVKFEKDILTLATDSLFNFLAAENLKRFLQKEVDLIFVKSEDLDSCLDKIYGKQQKSPGIQKEKGTEASEFLRQAQAISVKDESPMIKLTSLLFAEAYQNRASDVHLEPLEDKFRIRYRIDGVLRQAPGPPRRLTSALISRVKIMAGMDIAEKRLPQDGRIRFTAGNKELDLRVSTIPSIYGESIVVRILDRSHLVSDLEKLGFTAEDKTKYEDLIKLPNGIILVTGPTGCGKTTTLYTSLSQINKPNKKLLTLEDPVEYQLTGINQVQIKQEIGLTFARGLRAMLRQAPDIIMVGEIRDYETAAIAIQASLTGHLIFSTLHTNDAPGAVIRLIDMGVRPYLVASTLQGVLAQRLIRSLCLKCRQAYTPGEDQLKAFGKDLSQTRGITFYQAKGCDECHFTGYKGRIGIFELLILDDEIRSLISERYLAYEIRRIAKGMHSLREDGWLKVTQGLTTLSEVLRVTQQ